MQKEYTLIRFNDDSYILCDDKSDYIKVIKQIKKNGNFYQIEYIEHTANL